MNVKRTEQFLYFQNKAKHYQNIKKARPFIKSFRDSSQSQYRPRPNSLLKQYEDFKTNQSLVNNIMSIKNSPRARITIQNAHCRYNDYKSLQKTNLRGSHQQLLQRSIQFQNQKLGNKLLKMKPQVGTITDWNANFENIQSRKRIASKINANNSMSIYSKNAFIPVHYQSFMEKDGSTVALREKLFELPKIINDSYSQNQQIRNRNSNSIKSMIATKDQPLLQSKTIQ